MVITSAWLAAGGPWLPRMATTEGYTVIEGDRYQKGRERMVLADHPLDPSLEGHDLDDNDSATLGAMLGEVRRVWGDPFAYSAAYEQLGGQWTIWIHAGPAGSKLECMGDIDTEAGALAAAYRAGTDR